MRHLMFSIILIFIYGCDTRVKQEGITKKKPNILFIAIDDLRPEIGTYGSEIAITPNLDKLASEGLQFNRAYCQEPICSPSRASLMTGSRPETINVIENFTYFRDANPDIVTLPQYFRRNGYETVHTGKIYHKPAFADLDSSWSRKPAVDKMNISKSNTPGDYAKKENQEMFKKNRKEVIYKYGPNAPRNGLGKGPAYENADVEDTFYEDGYNAELAIVTMREMIEENPDKPFFLGLGMKKPHLEWLAPKKYWDMYDPDAIKLANNNKAPEKGAAMGLHPSFELRARYGIPKQGLIEEDQARILKHAYLACVSYVDAQIGKVIEALNDSGLRENTIIMVWSDHGFHLGEMGIWGKATNYEISTRVPLIVWTPEMTEEVRGVKTEALVELVDMYPTLVELADLDQPSHLEGQSFVPLLSDPNREWKSAVFSQFPTPALREWAANPLSKGMRETYFGPLIEEVEAKIQKQQGDKWNRKFFENDLMGYAMRTKRYRFIVWKDYKNLDKDPIYFELYDHYTDPQETKNIADEQPDLVSKLMNHFNKGWKGNLAKM